MCANRFKSGKEEKSSVISSVCRMVHRRRIKMGQALISVIIPVYNVEMYLKRCVDSVISQTYTNLEIWLVDDGSTDSCPQICDEYERKDARIRVIHKKNGGQSEARNIALDQMTGEYVTFVDADDFIRRQTIELLLEGVEKHGADMCGCRMEYGKADSFSDKATAATGIDRSYTGEDVYVTLFDDDTRELMGAACGKLYTREVFDGLRFCPDKAYEDEFLIHHILSKCCKIVILKDKLYYHFERQDSTTRRKYTLKSLDAVEAINDRCNFFENKGNEYLVFLCYREYLRRVQFHYYSLRKYFPEDIEKRSQIFKDYQMYYNRIKGDMGIPERIRYGMFLWLPELNMILKRLAGARTI